MFDARTLGASLLSVALVAACSSGTAEEPRIVGQWEAVGGTLDGDRFPLVDGHRITMNVADDGTLGGTAACNGYGATYVADGEDLIVGEMSSTAMGCQEEVMESERAFLSFVSEPMEYERDGDELSIRTDRGELRMIGVSPVPTEELIGTEWVLTSLVQGDEVTAPAGAEATLLLTPDGAVSGSTGCRALEGEYVVNADTVLFTTFSALGQCPAGLADQDGLVVTVLGDGFTVDIEGDRLTVTSVGEESLVYRANR